MNYDYSLEFSCINNYSCNHMKCMYLQPQGLQRKSSFYVTRRISCITCKPICKEHKLYVDC